MSTVGRSGVGRHDDYHAPKLPAASLSVFV